MDFETGLLKAVATVDTFGGEIDLLKAEADRLTSSRAFHGLRFGSETRTTEPEPYISRNGWVAVGWRWTFPAHRMGRPAGSLSLLVDIGGLGRPAKDLGAPCLVVAWSPAEGGWDAILDNREGPFWPVLESGHALLHARLFIQRDPDGTPEGPCLANANWFYVLPLFAVDGADALQGLVVDPVARLVAKDHPGDVLDAIVPAYRFAWRDGHPARLGPDEEESSARP